MYVFFLIAADIAGDERHLQSTPSCPSSARAEGGETRPAGGEIQATIISAKCDATESGHRLFLGMGAVHSVSITHLLPFHPFTIVT